MTTLAVLVLVLTLLVVAVNVAALWPLLRHRRTRLLVGAVNGLDHADRLGFVNEPPADRQRSPDFQYVTRVPDRAVHRVLDDF